MLLFVYFDIFCPGWNKQYIKYVNFMAIVNFLWTGGKLHKNGPWGKSLKNIPWWISLKNIPWWISLTPPLSESGKWSQETAGQQNTIFHINDFDVGSIFVPFQD